MASHSQSELYYFVFLRHGESEGNAQGIWQGQSDFPLTTRGKNQAQAVALDWQQRGVTFDAAVSSPLERTRETAEIITRTLQIPLTLDSIWMERDNGKYAGTSRRDRGEEPAFTGVFDPVGETGETGWDLYLRGGQAVAGLLRQPPGRYLVVSHGGILNLTLYSIFGINPLANFQGPRFAFGNTGYATLTYKPSRHSWELLGINEQAHLSLMGDQTIWED